MLTLMHACTHKRTNTNLNYFLFILVILITDNFERIALFVVVFLTDPLSVPYESLIKRQAVGRIASTLGKMLSGQFCFLFICSQSIKYQLHIGC